MTELIPDLNSKTKLRLAVFGTSLLWGQGLDDAHKIHNLFAQMLRDLNHSVEMVFLAHSGASTGYLADGSIDTHREPQVAGEVPTLYPTILQEIDAFDDWGVAPELIDVVLLDAGVNDVHVTRILDPVIPPQEIATLVDLYCDQHMRMLLEVLLAKFSRAKIVVMAYYEFVTEESEEAYVHSLLKAFGKLPVGWLADLVLETGEGLFKRRLLANCDVFASRSLEAFKRIADDLNRYQAEPRVLLACPEFREENAAFASDPWLYGINDDLSPQDPVARERIKACQCAGGHRTQTLFCKRASAGHPNPKGAKAYAEAIAKALSIQPEPGLQAAFQNRTIGNR